VCGVDSIERQIQSNALWWGGREVYVAEKYMAELSATHPTATPQITTCEVTRDHDRHHVWQPSMPQNMFSLTYGHVGRS
jgi:hypothetical protein